jgi:hypothetical protein
VYAPVPTWMLGQHLPFLELWKDECTDLVHASVPQGGQQRTAGEGFVFRAGSVQVLRFRSCVFILVIPLFAASNTGCVGPRTAVKREVRWVIPAKCISYVAYSRPLCEPYKASGEVYVCREVLIKSSCIEVKK